jgi:hypothetical protein
MADRADGKQKQNEGNLDPAPLKARLYRHHGSVNYPLHRIILTIRSSTGDHTSHLNIQLIKYNNSTYIQYTARYAVFLSFSPIDIIA